MTRNFAAICLLAIVIASGASSQGHYPLQVGTRWDYGYIEMGKFYYAYTEQIDADTLMANGHIYAIRATPTNPNSMAFLRQSGDTLFEYRAGNELLLYRFNVQTGDTIGVYYSPWDTANTVAFVGHDQVFNVQRKLWSFISQSLHSSGYGQVSIADSVGRTYAFYEGGYNEYLIGAIIGGVQYGMITSINTPGNNIVRDFRLFQNFPNPFNPSTTIQYALPDPSTVTLTVVDLLGRTVHSRDLGVQETGFHRTVFNGEGLSSGIYFYHVVARSTAAGSTHGAYSAVGRMLLTK